jgi:peptidoglycan/LPS O-acetylase OafA/YrhL
MTAFTLKIIALSAMLFDHLWVVFPDTFPFWFRGIGRLAYPIFVYLLAEGFRHTKAREKFLLRLLVFAIISEIPYDLAMGNDINFIANTNIFYTLFLGGMAICLFERMKEKRSWQTMAVITAILPTAILAEILSVDYGGMGVLFIFAMYAIIPTKPRLLAFTAFALSQFIPLVVAYFMEIKIPPKYFVLIIFALATIPLIILYNGQRGVKAKWLFYAAYPVHLAVLAIIAMMINGFQWS